MTAGTEMIVRTGGGLVRGLPATDDSPACFLGIPYAEPPVGPLRFRHPVPVHPWQGVRDATLFGPASVQLFDPHEGAFEEFGGDPASPEPWVGSEDSLTVNIWTPGVEGRRPVVVWIHGGANWLESSRLPIYHGDKLVMRGDVVFVSFNYRLGIFGFLDLEPLGGPDYAGSHSNGLRDQVTALRWIKANIAAFGGDPEAITVMGESAGSMDISWLLTSGHLDGIARRAVMMSGVGSVSTGGSGAGAPSSVEEGRRRGGTLLRAMGIERMEDMLALDTAGIMNRFDDFRCDSSILFELDTLFYPRAPRDFAATEPMGAMRAGQGANIDLLIGFTGYEMGLWLLWDDQLDNQSAQWAAAKAYGLPPALVDEAAAFYDQACAEEAPGVRGMHLLSDGLFGAHSYAFADAHAAAGGACWFYRFDWEADPRRRALHSADVFFMLGKADTHIGRLVLGEPADEAEAVAWRRLSLDVMDSFLAFVRQGHPGTQNLPEWPRYTVDTRPTMLFDIVSRVENDPLGERRQWWMDHVHRPAKGVLPPL